jgi:hypothetical protein
VVASPASPNLTTNASSGVVVGSPIRDSATLAGGYVPTGIISFRVYGPDDATCATPIALYNGTGFSTVAVSGNGTYNSADFTPAAPGTYRWIANYSGGTNNRATANGCNGAGESVVISSASPNLTTNASAAVIVGNPIYDSAILAGGYNPTGAISFQVYGPNDATCATQIIAYNGTGVSTVSASGNGTYNSASFTPSAPGTYRWIANYGGDVNNSGTVNVCNGAGESVVISSASPTVITGASSDVVVGNPIRDSATLTGGYVPTGTISFRVYGPDDTTCATPIAAYNGTGVSSVIVSGNGTYSSADFTPAAPGIYRWIANYGGDANNAATANGCNGAYESVAVAPTGPTVVTNASSGVVVGNPIRDSAILTGATANATGDISFTIYGPDDTACTTPIAAYNGTGVSTVSISGNGTYISSDFTPSVAGTYRWIANYGGDANNAATTNGCMEANESVVVAPTSPTVVTNASSAVVVGSPIHDSAILAGATASATGKISFQVYGPDDTTCATPIALYNGIGVSRVSVSGNGTYISASYTPAAPGTYRWIANYGGDTNNSATANGCNGAGESVVISSASPTVTTNASASVIVGNPIYDTATLSGGYNPSGTINFALYGPDDTTCSSSIFSGSVGVSGNGQGQSLSDTFVPASAGTYRWIANYGGDANNSATANGCNEANESVVVTPGLSISGTVYGPDGITGLFGISVMANAGGFHAGTQTGADGTYSIAVPLNAAYTMQFQDNNSTYVGGCYSGSGFTTDWSACSPVTVTTGPVSGIDVVMPLGQHISGRVTGPGGAGLPNISVNANNGQFATGTDNNGNYLLTVLPGNYTITFYDDGSTYVSGCYSSSGFTVQFYDCTPVPAGATGINVVMPPGWRISGRVTAPGGAGLPNISVMAIGGYSRGFGTQTDTNGDYSLMVLPGSYPMEFQDNNSTYASGCYSSAGFTPYQDDCTQVVVNTGPRNGIDVVMPLGQHISGRVTGPDGTPLAHINVYERSGSSYGFATQTGSNGYYLLMVPSGDYTVMFYDESLTHVSGCYAVGSSGLVAALYSFTNSPACTPVDASSGATGIDVTLPLPGEGIKTTGNAVIVYPISADPAGIAVYPVSADPAGTANSISLTFADVGAGGSTSAVLGSAGPPMSIDFQLAGSPTYYDVTTTADYSGSITLCVPYDPTAYSGSDPVLLHWNGTNWDDVTSSFDPVSAMICGTVTSLSPFVVGRVAASAAPTPTPTPAAAPTATPTVAPTPSATLPSTTTDGGSSGGGGGGAPMLLLTLCAAFAVIGVGYVGLQRRGVHQ